MAAIDRLSPSQQLEIVIQRRDEGLSYRELERWCLDKYQVEVSYQTIKNYFDNALATLPRNVRDLKASAILGLADQITKLETMAKEASTNVDMSTKDIMSILAERTKLLLGVCAIKPDMPLPTAANTPGEVTVIEKRLSMHWGKPVETAEEAKAHSERVIDGEGTVLDDR